MGAETVSGSHSETVMNIYDELEPLTVYDYEVSPAMDLLLRSKMV